jgi:hypothetical protein
VLDEDGAPLPGVSILKVGSRSGEQTDFDGKFVIYAKKGDKLAFSYVGMLPQTITIGDAKEISITLVQDAAALDEIVITAFGKQKK